MQDDSLDENLFPRDLRQFDLFDAEEQRATAMLEWTQSEDGVDVSLRGGELRVAPHGEDIMRIVLSSASGADAASISDPPRSPLDMPPSYLLVHEDRAAETAAGAAGGEDSPPTPTAVTVAEGQETLVIETGHFSLQLDRGSGMLTLSHAAAGRILQTKSDQAFRWSRRGTALDIELGDGVAVYGLGEKTGHLDRRGRSYRMWNADEPTHLPNRDPLYQSIPFLLMPIEEPQADGSGWMGLLLDAPGSSWFDVGERDGAVLTAAVEDRRLQAYVMAGRSPGEVLSRYTRLTGHAPLPPLWALGYHQSRHSYTPADRVREIADNLRARKLPADVIHLDIEYMDGYRVFTWDPVGFRDPAGLIRELAEQGFHVVTIVDPGVKVDPDYAVYRQGLELDAFCRTEAGELYEGRVWPGSAVFPDFSNPLTRAWWADKHRALFDLGVSGIWNDMNEPSDFTGDFIRRPELTPPSSVMMNGDGYPRSMDAYHNVYGTLMSRATRAGAENARPGKRPFVLTRAGSAGIQRFAAVWTGDNHSWWEHLQASISMLLGMGLSGVGFVGADVGGFQDSPTPELYARWIQYAALTPFMRTHTSSNTRNQEPWSFGPEIEKISRRYLELRYRLLPYLYNLFYRHSLDGTPVMRPLMWHYPTDPMVRNLNTEFLLGEAVLAAPLTQPGARARAVYLPAGRWMDFWTGRRFDGGRHVLAEAPLERMPIYVKIPALIPMVPVIQSTAEFHGRPLELWLFGADEGRPCSLDYYEDDADTVAHADGASSIYTITWDPGEGNPAPVKGGLTVEPRRTGFSSPRPRWELVIADGPTRIDLGLPPREEPRRYPVEL